MGETEFLVSQDWMVFQVALELTEHRAKMEEMVFLERPGNME